jgi:hypothetical protein
VPRVCAEVSSFFFFFRYEIDCCWNADLIINLSFSLGLVSILCNDWSLMDPVFFNSFSGLSQLRLLHLIGFSFVFTNYFAYFLRDMHFAYFI